MSRIITSYTRPKPTVVASGLYFSPGYNGGGIAELWTTDGTTTSLVWTDPTSGDLAISYLAHCTTTGKLYIFCVNYAPTIGSDFDVDVYALDPNTNIVTHFAGPYNYANLAFTFDKPATHAAEYGGLLYVGHQGGRDEQGAYVASLNPTSGATALVASATGSALIDLGAGEFQPDYTGGLGVIGATLYWTDGVGLWSGGGGSLSFDSYLGYMDPTNPTDVDGFGACGNPISNPLDSTMYIPGQYCGDETPTNGYDINANISRRMIDQSGSTIVDLGCLSDTNAPNKGGAFYNRLACCAMLYDVDDVTPLAPYAFDDGIGEPSGPGPTNLFVWSGPSWSQETDLAGLVTGVRGCSNCAKSFHGEMFVMASQDFSGNTYLFKRSVTGSWSVLHTFSGYTVPKASTYPNMLPVARVSGTIKCHQM